MSRGVPMLRKDQENPDWIAPEEAERVFWAVLAQKLAWLALVVVGCAILGGLFWASFVLLPNLGFPAWVGVVAFLVLALVFNRLMWALIRFAERFGV